MLSFPPVGHLRHLAALFEKCPDVVPSGAAVLQYRGTTKIHVTNAAVGLPKGSNLACQSRTRVVDEDRNNHGSAAFVGQRRVEFEGRFARFREGLPSEDADGPCHIFGEFAGRGIQRGVAVSGLPKFFFKVAPDGQPLMDVTVSPNARAQIFANATITPERVRQGLASAYEQGKIGPDSLGAAAAWCAEDALREESSLLVPVLTPSEARAFGVALRRVARGALVGSSSLP